MLEASFWLILLLCLDSSGFKHNSHVFGVVCSKSHREHAKSTHTVQAPGEPEVPQEDYGSSSQHKTGFEENRAVSKCRTPLKVLLMNHGTWDSAGRMEAMSITLTTAKPGLVLETLQREDGQGVFVHVERPVCRGSVIRISKWNLKKHIHKRIFENWRPLNISRNWPGVSLAAGPNLLEKVVVKGTDSGTSSLHQRLRCRVRHGRLIPNEDATIGATQNIKQKTKINTKYSLYFFLPV